MHFVYAQESLTVSTDATQYGFEDRYTISGVVSPFVPNQWVLIQIAAPNNPNLASIPVKPTPDGKYFYTLQLGNKNIPVGNFTITARYAEAQNQTQFNYLGTKCNRGDMSPNSVPIIREPASNPEILDSFGKLITGPVKVGKEIQVTAHIDLGQSGCQRFAYLVQIQNEDGVNISLSWLTGMLFSGQSLHPAQSWIPSVPGTYTAQIFLWESLANPNSLAPPLNAVIDVTDSEIGKRLERTSANPSPLEQINSGTDPYFVNCEKDLDLVIKLKNNSPACVNSSSLAELLAHGWILAHDNNGKYDRLGRDINEENEPSSACKNEFKPKDFELTVFSNGSSHTVNYNPVFLMKPNSVAKICLNYWQTTPEMNFSGKVTAGIGKDNSDVQDLTIIPYPNTITIDNTNKTIVYTITSSKNSNGFYRFTPMFSNCGGIPIAIGYNSTHSFDNDFLWLWDVIPCPLPVANYQITGLSGMDVVYITKEF